MTVLSCAERCDKDIIRKFTQYHKTYTFDSQRFNSNRQSEITEFSQWTDGGGERWAQKKKDIIYYICRFTAESVSQVENMP